MSDQHPVRVFLDANVLYAACLSPSGGSARLWTVPTFQLVTSEYALCEAWENLAYQPSPRRFESAAAV
jgi:predicted nucleic acid-binding protein